MKGLGFHRLHPTEPDFKFTKCYRLVFLFSKLNNVSAYGNCPFKK